MKDLFLSSEGKAAVMQLYDQKLESLGLSAEQRDIPTSFGNSRVIITGNPEKAPIVLVHGSNGNAPIALETYKALLSEFRVYAIDLLAQPNKSEGTLLSMKDNSYGIWMNEVLDSLQLDSVTMAGFSLGGLVILKTLEYNESRVKQVFLSAPAYIVNGNPLKALFKVFIPMKAYMRTKKQKHLEKFLSSLFSERDEFAVEYLTVVLLEFELDFTPVPVIASEKAAKIQTPITIFAAENDAIFPGKKMVKRASKIFPSLANVELIPNSKHVQNKQDNTYICEKILEAQ
ncbi:MAG: alpha/beta hydrolase [Flavobacteriales bacterium]|nr:alpha/beta hydrolase [Flavobacteriales bacterium]